MKQSDIKATVELDGVKYWLIEADERLLDKPSVVPPLTPEPLPKKAAGKRAEVVAAAASQVGLSDKAPYCKLACVQQEPYNWPKYWCAMFNLWCYLIAGLNVVKRDVLSSAWYFSRQFQLTTDPQPGDTAYFKRAQHHAIVEWRRGDEVGLINGNGKDGKVTRSVAKLSEVTCFYSIGKYV